MRKNIQKSVFFLALLLLSSMIGGGLIFAQPVKVDREVEQKEYPALRFSESIAEQNVFQIYRAFADFSYMVNAAKRDRNLYILEEKQPLSLKDGERELKYVPYKTYVRFVQEDPSLVLTPFGVPEEIMALIDKKTEEARKRNIAVDNFSFANRGGIELTRYDFIRVQGPTKKHNTGAKLKSLTLFYRSSGATDDPRNRVELEVAIMSVVHDDFRQGMRFHELIIDPNPKDSNMDDVIILSRMNRKPTKVVLLGAMSNSSAYPLRLRFKKRYTQQLSDYIGLYRRLAQYNELNGNRAHERLIQRFQHSLNY